MAIYTYFDTKEYMSISDRYDASLQILKFNDITILDSSIPKDWIEIKHSYNDQDYAIQSFSEWANNPIFFNWLMEDDWYGSKSKNAFKLLANKCEEYEKQFVIQRFNSIDAAKKIKLQKEYQEKLQLHFDRGYEKPLELDLSQETLDATQLTVANVWELKEHEQNETT